MGPRDDDTAARGYSPPRSGPVDDSRLWDRGAQRTGRAQGSPLGPDFFLREDFLREDDDGPDLR